jgi:membrane fusion protein (multidrug efflux system)
MGVKAMQKQEQTARRRTLAGGLALAFLLLGTGCDNGDGEEAPPPPPVEVVTGTAVLTQVEDQLTAVGTLEANERLEVKPESPGLIEAIRFTEGERVQQGQTLFELDSRKEEAAVVQAEAELMLAQSNLDRAQTLVGTKAISQQEVDKLASELAVRSAVLKVRKEDLADRKMTAPFDGLTGPRLVSPGQYVNAGTLLGTLVDDSVMKVRCSIPERGLAYVRAGQTGRVGVNTFPDRSFTGRVDLVGPEVDETTRTAEVRLIVPNSEGLLRPGMFARVEIIVAVRPEALVIPEGALVPSMDAFSVYVVQDSKALLKPVQIGVRLPGRVEIVEGLQPNQEIVLSGTQKLVDGMSIIAAAPTNAPTGESAVVEVEGGRP